jgi:hypothetical protein
MQVSDSQAAARAGVPGKDEVTSPADGSADRRRRRSGRGFRGALENRRADSTGGVHDDVASAAALAGWFRSESTSGAAPTAAPPRAPAVAAARTVDRILIGSGPDGAQARIRIGAGALAGTEIQLSSSAAGRAVEAQLLTHTASSRQTLSVVLDEIRSRLQDRGIVLSAKAAPARSAPRARDFAREEEGERHRRAGESRGEGR